MASSGDRQAITADGQTTGVDHYGPVRLSITGGFGGGTVKLQALDPSNAWVDIAGASFTAVTDTLYDFPAASKTTLRVDVNGSTTPTLVIWIQGGN